MTWLYIPPRALTPAAGRICSAYRSAPAPEASTSDLRWPSPDTVLWVTASNDRCPRGPRHGNENLQALAKAFSFGTGQVFRPL